VALRTLAPVAAATVAVAVLYGSPLAVIGPFAAVLFPPGPSPFAAVAAAALLVGVATVQAPRLVTGLDGWIRHLPASGAAQRRGAAAGLVVALAPVLVLVVVAGLSRVAVSPDVNAARLVGLPVVAWAAALASLPVRRVARAAAGLAAVACATGWWWSLALGAGLLVLAEVSAGRLQTRRRRALTVGDGTRGAGSGAGAVAVWLRVCTRAVGHRVLGCWAVAALPLLAAVMFLANNQLERGQELVAVRLAGLAAMVLTVGSLADVVVKRRPPWPWVRSLPASARWRVSIDAAFLAAAAVPAIAATALIDVVAVPALAVTLPVLALRASAAIRYAPGRSSGASGQVLAEGGLAAVVVAMVPAASLLLLASAPLALRWAASAERRQDVSRWHELHYLAAGDSLSWSDS
jgi:hypothetical protein